MPETLRVYLLNHNAIYYTLWSLDSFLGGRSSLLDDDAVRQADNGLGQVGGSAVVVGGYCDVANSSKSLIQQFYSNLQHHNSSKT